MKKGLFFTVFALLSTSVLHAQNSSPYWSLAGNSNATTSSKLGTTNNVYLRFFANNVERGRVNTNGNWGIGDVGTDARLTISSAANTRAFRVRVGGDTKFAVQANGGVTIGTLDPGPANGLYVVGDMGIGTPTPSSDLHILHTNGFVSNGLTLKNSFAAGLSWNIYSATTDELWFSNDGIRRATIDGTSGAYTSSSDRRLKKDIVPMESVLEKVMKLSPKLYHFNTQTESGVRRYIGLIAQEVQPVFPESVYEHRGNNDGAEEYLTMDYSTFGVISIKAIQEQQLIISEQRERLNTMEARISKLEALLTGNGTVTYNAAYLEQNTPNPVRGSTTIRYAIPESATSARLTITNAKGQVVKTVSLNSKGTGQIHLNTSGFSSGTYQYSLWIDGKQADTKRLVVVR